MPYTVTIERRAEKFLRALTTKAFTAACAMPLMGLLKISARRESVKLQGERQLQIGHSREIYRQQA